MSMFRNARNTSISGGNFTSVNNTHIHSEANRGYERLLSFVAPNALHDVGHTFDLPRCHPGTRVAVIQTIIDWMEGVHEQTRERDIAWVTGAAGAGKSAIGRSICERCAEEGRLLASFFFSSSDSTRNHSGSLVATIAYQMCCKNYKLRKAVSDAVDHDPLVFSRSLRTQFLSLVINPLSVTFADEPHVLPRLIVIDGLDECQNTSSQEDILDTLTYISTSSPIPFRFLVCSRPESHITSFFLSPTVQDLLFKILLGEDYSPYEDIRLYLSDSFKDIKAGHKFKHLLPAEWPEEDHMDDIVEKSSGQFIYATTVVKYMRSPSHRPDQRLESVLGLRPPFKDLPFVQLDALYMHIIKSANDSGLLLDILLIVAICQHLDPGTIDLILSLEQGNVEVLLSDFESIVKIECFASPHRAVKLLHKSLADFLFDPQRSKEFYKDQKEKQSSYLLRIMQIYSGLHLYGRILSESGQPVTMLSSLEISCEDWDSMIYSTPLKAIIEFPMESFCRSLFSDTSVCNACNFFRYFFGFLHQHSQNESINEAWVIHYQAFWDCILAEIRGARRENWKSTYLFTASCIHDGHKIWYLNTFFKTTNDNFDHTLIDMWGEEQDNDEPFPLSKGMIEEVEKCSIYSRVAAYCLQAICDQNPRLRWVAKRFLRIGILLNTNRKTHPWKWHRRAWSRQSEDQQLIDITPFDPTCLTTFRKVAHFADHREDHGSGLLLAPLQHIYSYWFQLPSSINDLPFEYATLLQSLIKTLPRAAPYAPLIEMCKTQTFSPMSMAFPHLSRAARKEITRYLKRTGNEDSRTGKRKLANMLAS